MTETPVPALFIGHGSPMNVLRDNHWTTAWAALGRVLRARAVLCVSAHWYGPGMRVTAGEAPLTIHDFRGFPDELHRFRYPAPGQPLLAARVCELLAPLPVIPDPDRGLDHGAWSVLCHMFPEAGVPVVELGMDSRLAPQEHYRLARLLAPLRREGVLVLGSGNLVHNLAEFDRGGPAGVAAPWAARFEKEARALMRGGEHRRLADYRALGEDARRSIPTPEHFLPLLYVLALQEAGDPLSFPAEGFEGGSLSMLAVRVG